MHRQSLTLILSIMPLMLNAGDFEQAAIALAQPQKIHPIQCSPKISSIHNNSPFDFIMHFGRQEREIPSGKILEVDVGIPIPTDFTPATNADTDGDSPENISFMIPSVKGIAPRSLVGKVNCTQQLINGVQFISVYAKLDAVSPSEGSATVVKAHSRTERVPPAAISAYVCLAINICYGNRDEDTEGTNVQSEITFEQRAETPQTPRRRQRSHSTGEKHKSHSAEARQRSRSIGTSDEVEKTSAKHTVTPESPQLAAHRRRSCSTVQRRKSRSMEDRETLRNLRHSTEALLSPRTTITSLNEVTPSPKPLQLPTKPLQFHKRPSTPYKERPNVTAPDKADSGRARQRSMTSPPTCGSSQS